MKTTAKATSKGGMSIPISYQLVTFTNAAHLSQTKHGALRRNGSQKKNERITRFAFLSFIPM